MNLSSHIDFILETYHTPLKIELPTILMLSEKATRVHGEIHPELIRMREILQDFSAEMTKHLYKEETILFPMIRDLDRLQASGETPAFHCGKIGNPIRKMNSEHQDFDRMFAELRTLSNGYAPPEGACNTYRTLFQKLTWLETETIAHAAFESDTLFVEAEKVEALCH